MGDQDRSMEAKQDGEQEMKMVLHCPPIYPLPEEIRKMERSETVCLYCGVSYLVYHEFHQLNTRLAQLEAELQGLRERGRAEKAQREALELGRLEWERALRLEVQRQVEEKEKSTRVELEERSRDTEKVLREELQLLNERKRREMKEKSQEFSEKESQLRGELGDLEGRLTRQREELERTAEQREKVLGDTLQKAKQNLDALRKEFQELEERLAMAANSKEEAEQLLGEEQKRGEMLRGVCVRQQQALRGTVSDVRGFLGQLMGAWQAFRSQILQQSTQVLSVLKEELKNSSVDFQKMREENEQLTQQLMEQGRQREEQLCQQRDSDREHGENLLRLKGELQEEHERCRQRCDVMQEQLSSWGQRGEQTNRKWRTAEEEVTRLREVLERVQQESRELRKEREILIESHSTALTEIKKDCRQQMASKLAASLEEQRTQNALHLREQMEELRREAELELTIDREKNQLLLLQYQRDSTLLRQNLEEREQELRGLQDGVQEERRRREEERRKREEDKNQQLQHSQQQAALRLSQAKDELQRMAERNAELQEELEEREQELRGLQDGVQEERRRREEERRKREEGKNQLQHSQQQAALRLSQAKDELQRMAERNAELQEEVDFLQETVRRECEEREELTAALSRAQDQRLALRSLVSHQGSYSPPPDSTERHLLPQGNKHVHSPARVPLTHSSTSPNTLPPSSPAHCTDRDGGEGGAEGSLDSGEQKSVGVVLGGRKKQEGILPRLKGAAK